MLKQGHSVRFLSGLNSTTIGLTPEDPNAVNRDHLVQRLGLPHRPTPKDMLVQSLAMIALDAD
jgi:hypothetical protein